MFGFCAILVFFGATCLANAQDPDKDVELITEKMNAVVNVPMKHNIMAQSQRAYFVNDFYGPQPQPAPEPTWKVSANLVGDSPDGPRGQITFKQFSPNSPVLMNINATGLMEGKHAIHIHAFGDIEKGCNSTGPHFRHILIGNIDVREGGAIDLSFYSSNVGLFGHQGIVGRSIVIHEKPIEYNRFPDIYGVPAGADSIAYQSEEQAVGKLLACGVISIVENIATIRDIKEQ